jgi:hypothetical protein
MASRGGFFPAAALALCFFSAAILSAQEGSRFLARDGADPRFVQRLSWGYDALAFRYEVILDQERNGRYVELLREGTEQNYLSLSLPPGRYRYAVGVYNLLDKLEYTMDRVYFEVLRALRPRILSFSPEEFFLDDGPLLLALSGQDIAEGADIMIRVPGRPGRAIRPRQAATQGDTVLLSFGQEQLEPGDYEVYVRNPGGLEDSRGTIGIRVRKKEEPPAPEVASAEPAAEQAAQDASVIAVSAGYAPLIYLYGALLAADVFESPMFPLGVAARLQALPLKLDRISLGAALDVSWHWMEEQKDAYTVSAQLLEARLNLLCQYWLPNRIMALNLRLGGGLLLIKDFQFDYGKGGETLDSAYLSLGAGLSFQWQVAGPFFIEAGATFTHILSSGDNAQPGYLQPALSAGWKW